MEHTENPNREPPRDAALVQKWSLAVLGAVGLVLALIIIATLAISGDQQPAPRAVAEVVHVSGATFAAVDYLSVSPGIKPGADGQLHDAYSQTTFYVHAGHPVKLVIDNTDNVPHGIVSPAAGVAITVRPGTHTYTLMVRKAGTFQWHCNQPCDPYSMAEMGYMMGEIVST